MGGVLSGSKGSGGGVLGGGGKSPGHSHGVFGLIKNFGHDVADAVTALPTGLVMTAEHPIRSGKLMARATWQDWKPLAEGHPVQFLHQTYDHPLAPLLDVASVFSAGAGISAKIGAGLSEAGMGGRLAESAAALGRRTSRVVEDTRAADTGVARVPMMKHYGSNAGSNLRRQLANRALLHLEPHLPAWFKQSERQGRLYEKLANVEKAHRGLALRESMSGAMTAHNFQIQAAVKAGHALEDPSIQHILQPEILNWNHEGIKLHAFDHPADQPLHHEFAYLGKDGIVKPKLAYRKGETMAQRMETLGREVTVDKPQAAHLGRKPGTVLVVRRGVLHDLGNEGKNSAHFLTKLYQNPVKIWKRVQVGYAPRVVTNNAVGNWTMYAMRQAGHGSARGVLDAVRYAHGDRAAMTAFKEMHKHVLDTQGVEASAKFTAMAHPALAHTVDEAALTKAFGAHAAKAVARPANWRKKHFADELGNTFGNVLEADQNAGKFKTAYQRGLYPLVHRIADKPVREAALSSFLRKSPEVKSFLKTHPGTSIDSAIDQVLTKHPDLRGAAVEHVRSIAGDYVAKNAAEHLVQNIVPFYLWDKHIVKHFSNLVKDKPGRVAMMQQLSQMGGQERDKMLGKIPDFLSSALPLSLFGMHDHNGRTPLLLTNGLNPYSTEGDLAKTALGLTTGNGATTGSDVAGQINPILRGVVEQLSGHKLGSQAPASTLGGVLPSVLANTVTGTTYGTLIKRAIEGTPKPKVQPNGTSKPFLYEKTPQESVAGLFGIPVKNVSLPAAAALADKLDPSKKRKKVKPSGYGG
jgi:hypothetical protein